MIMNIPRIILSLIACLLLVSCSKEEAEEFRIQVEQTTFNVSSKASDVSVAVTSNGEWVVTSEAAWLSADRTEGVGNQNFTIHVLENKTHGERMGKLRIGPKASNDNSQVVVLTVIQSQDDAVLIYDSNIHAPWQGGTYKIVYADNNVSEVIIPEDVDWVHCETNARTRALSHHVLTVTVDENDGAERQCAVTITGGEASEQIEVRQEPFIPLEAIEPAAQFILIQDMESRIIQLSFSPEQASDKEITWTNDSDGIVDVERLANDRFQIKAIQNGQTMLHFTNPRSGISIYMPIEVRINAKAMRWSHYTVLAGYGSVFSQELILTPSNASTWDLTITSSDEEIVKFNGTEFVCGNKSGEAIVTASLPSCLLKAQFVTYVQEFYTRAGISQFHQHDDTFILHFAGHIYSYNKADRFLVNNVMLCDAEGKVVAYSHFTTDAITIHRNGSYDVAFSTGDIDMSHKYGITYINSSTLNPFLQQWYFLVTYQRTYDEPLKKEYIFIDPYNWAMHIEPIVQ